MEDLYKRLPWTLTTNPVSMCEKARGKKGGEKCRYRLHLQPTGAGIPMQRRQRGGSTGGRGGESKTRGVRWGRAHSVGFLSCGAPRILLAEICPSVRREALLSLGGARSAAHCGSASSSDAEIEPARGGAPPKTFSTACFFKVRCCLGCVFRCFY